ncbi:hypothetical protein [Marinicrinis sediminis]|uniref:Uncharacterized protein n=1 Tax=Marinicrinis sediminis TaxID=1652465 RepID=A0ABW5RDM5_9BACL
MKRYFFKGKRHKGKKFGLLILLLVGIFIPGVPVRSIMERTMKPYFEIWTISLAVQFSKDKMFRLCDAFLCSCVVSSEKYHNTSVFVWQVFFHSVMTLYEVKKNSSMSLSFSATLFNISQSLALLQVLFSSGLSHMALSPEGL